jgi:ubiquinone biosynthesis protein COQ4
MIIMSSISTKITDDAILPHGTPVPLLGPGDDVRPKMGGTPGAQRYMQGDKLPITSSVLISSSKYLNNPYYREAFVTQALRRHGHDLPPTYMVPLMLRAIEEVTIEGRREALVEEEKAKNPLFAEWLAARRLCQFTLANTEHYDCGTLGQEIHTLLSTPGMTLDFSFAAEVVPTNDLAYMEMRNRVSHDLEHMITGFGPNTAGENALAMANITVASRFFTPELAQILSHAQMWIAATGIYRTSLHYHHVLPAYLDAVQQGIRVGLQLKAPLFMTPWEDYLDWQLEDIATDLGFERGPGREWDWTTKAASG